MTTKEAKALIGQAVKYYRIHGYYAHWHYAVILDVQGKNVMVDEAGITDWLWLPDVHIAPIAPDITHPIEDSLNEPQTPQPCRSGRMGCGME